MGRIGEDEEEEGIVLAEEDGEGIEEREKWDDVKVGSCSTGKL